MREERVALEDVADATGLRGKVDPHHASKNTRPSTTIRPGVRRDQTGHALQRQRLPRPRRTEQHGDAAARRPRHVELEARQLASEGDLEAIAHVARAPSRLAATSTRHDRAVRTPTSTSASSPRPSARPCRWPAGPSWSCPGCCRRASASRRTRRARARRRARGRPGSRCGPAAATLPAPSGARSVRACRPRARGLDRRTRRPPSPCARAAAAPSPWPPPPRRTR